MNYPRAILTVFFVCMVSVAAVVIFLIQGNTTLFQSYSLKHANNQSDWDHSSGGFTDRKSFQSRVGWQPLGASKDVYVFSAYYNEDSHIVEIVSVAERAKARSNFTCIYQSGANSGSWTLVEGLLVPVDSPPTDINFLTIRITCPIPKVHRPSEITVQHDNHTASLPIIYNPTGLYNFTVCVPSLFGPYSNYHRFIETIETDILFGAEHFIVYNYSVTPQVDKVLRHYISKGIMEVFQWHMPVEGYYNGQWAYLQDCHLNSRYKSKYLVIKDLDELIVSHKHNNWSALIHDAGQHNPKIGSFVFMNSFFNLNWKTDVSEYEHGTVSDRLKITSLQYVWREDSFSRDRCKSIIRPERVMVAGIHFTKRHVKDYVEQDIDPRTAFLHHYREWKNFKKKVKDVFMRKYDEEIIRRITQTLSEILSVNSISESFFVNNKVFD